jgi:hypothetical protein
MAPKDDKSRLSEDRIVEALVPDPAKGPPNTTVLHGYLGRGTEGGTWRLYISPQLDQWIELDEAEILHSEKLPDDQGTRVWVRAGTELQVAQASAQRVQAEFLSGPIAGAATAAAGAAAGAAAIPPPTVGIACSLVACPSEALPCPSEPPRCPGTLPVLCPPPTTPATGCPPPTTPLTGCPPPTTPLTGCPQPTTPQAGCPPLTRPPRCPSGIVPCVSVIRCPTLPLGCPTNVLRCPTRPIDCQITGFRCPSLAGCPSDFCGDTFDPGTLGF